MIATVATAPNNTIQAGNAISSPYPLKLTTGLRVVNSASGVVEKHVLLHGGDHEKEHILWTPTDVCSL